MKIDELEGALKGVEQGLTKEQALAKLEDLLKVMSESLNAAQAIADQYSLSFEVSLGGGGEHPWNEYSPREVGGRYYGKGSENEDGDEDEEGNTPKYDQGFWYWENSSLNC